jgi:hypothetical protein
MESDPASHILWLHPSRQCGISALNERDPAPTPGASVPFGSTQPSQSCVHDTDQLVEHPLVGIIDAVAQKNPVVNSYDRAVSCTLVRTLACVHHTTPCRATQRSHGPPHGLLSQENAWAGLGPHGLARNQLAFPRRGVSCFARSDSTAASDQTPMTCTTQFERNI